MKSFIKRLGKRIGDLTCGQVLAMSLAINVVCIVVAALLFFQPQY